MRRRIEFDFLHLGNLTTVRNHNAVNWSVRRNGNAVNDSVNRVAQKLKTGDKGDAEFAVREALTQRRWMVELNAARPTTNERTRVQVLYATDAEGFQFAT